MIILKFNPQGNLIVFNVELEHKTKFTANMALDTASSLSVITPEVAIRLGFDLGAALNMETVSTATQVISLPRLVIPLVRFYNEEVHNLSVLCVPLPSRAGVVGTLGLNFLRHFRLTLDFGEGFASFERLAPRSEARAQP